MFLEALSVWASCLGIVLQNSKGKGHCSYAKTQTMLNRASLLILPSICYEGFPAVICEAYASGVAVAASSIGAMSEIVKDGITGVLFDQGDICDIVKNLNKLIEAPNKLLEMGKLAKSEYSRNYTEEKNLNILLNIYKEALSKNK